MEEQTTSLYCVKQNDRIMSNTQTAIVAKFQLWLGSFRHYLLPVLQRKKETGIYEVGHSVSFPFRELNWNIERDRERVFCQERNTKLSQRKNNFIYINIYNSI